MYDLRHTAGVLRNCRATSLTAATMQPLSARSLLASGSGVRAMMSIAVSVPPHVRKSFAVNAAPVTSLRYWLTWPESTACTEPSSTYWNSRWPGN